MSNNRKNLCSNVVENLCISAFTFNDSCNKDNEITISIIDNEYMLLIQEIKKSFKEAEESLSKEKILHCLKLLRNIEKNEELEEILFNAQNLKEAIESIDKIEVLKEKLSTNTKYNILELIDFKEDIKKIRRNLRYLASNEKVNKYLVTLNEIDKNIELLEKSIELKDIEKEIENKINFLEEINVSNKKETYDYLLQLRNLMLLYNQFKAINKSLVNIEKIKLKINDLENNLCNLIYNFKSIDIISLCVDILEINTNDYKQQACKYFISTYKDKKYSSTLDLKKDLEKSILISTIKNSKETSEINNTIINYGDVEFINSGKFNRERICEKLISNKKHINSVEDVFTIIHKEIIIAKEEVENLIKDHKKLTMEIKELILKENNENIENKVINFIKTNKSINCVADIKAKVKNFIESYNMEVYNKNIQIKDKVGVSTIRICEN